MSLIEKFAAVEIKVDARISERDKQFCERQQAAYTAALHGFQELTFSGKTCCLRKKHCLENQTARLLPTIIIWFLAAMTGPKLPFSGFEYISIRCIAGSFNSWRTTFSRPTILKLRRKNNFRISFDSASQKREAGSERIFAMGQLCPAAL